MNKSKLLVLLVEDDNMARRLASFILKQLDCEVTEATSGQQAIELSQNMFFDLIFMDLGLPDKNGTEVAKSIRNSENKNSSTPIVALTAHGTEEDRKKCLEAQMNDFLVKPLNNENAEQIFAKLNLR